MNKKSVTALPVQAYLPPGLILVPCMTGNLLQRLKQPNVHIMDANQKAAPQKMERILRAGNTVALIAPPKFHSFAQKVATKSRARTSAIGDTPLTDLVAYSDDTNFSRVLPNSWNATDIEGPFDIIGDVHGQLAAMRSLLTKLGYNRDLSHPQGRLAIFVGDLVDKGPNPIDVFFEVTDAVYAGRALCVRGNHEHSLTYNLRQILRQKNPSAAFAANVDGTNEGRAVTLEAIQRLPDLLETCETIMDRIALMPFHMVFDNEKLAVVHASAKPELFGDMQGDPKLKREARNWFLYGPPANSGYSCEDWSSGYSSDTMVVHGHVEQQVPSSHNNVVAIDTGAGKGDSLTSFSWPEQEFTTVQV